MTVNGQSDKDSSGVSVGGSQIDRDVALIVVYPWCEWKLDTEITTSWFYFQLRSAAEEYTTLRCVMWPCWFDPHLLRILHSSTGG